MADHCALATYPAIPGAASRSNYLHVDIHLASRMQYKFVITAGVNLNYEYYHSSWRNPGALHGHGRIDNRSVALNGRRTMERWLLGA